MGSEHLGTVRRAGLVDSVEARLAAAGCVAAYKEAEELVAAAPDGAVLKEWVARRERGEPLAWITGHVEFAGRVVSVDAGVYVPRAQSEALAVRATALLPPRGRAADLCTGCGAVAAHLAVAHPAAIVVGTEIDSRAAACARRNGVTVVVADLDCGLASAAFDVVTAVTPYVPAGELRYLPVDVVRYEPRLALDGGPDGLDTFRRLVIGAARILRPGGWLLAELGGDQARPAASLLGTAAFDAPSFWCDEEGDLRGVAARHM